METSLSKIKWEKNLPHRKSKQFFLDECPEHISDKDNFSKFLSCSQTKANAAYLSLASKANNSK